MGSVGYLLDTHTFLWATQDDARLSEPAKMAMNDKKTQKFISAASAYEITYKYRLGKLPGYVYVEENYIEILRNLGAEELPIKTQHAYLAGKMDWEHKDPFDRFLAAQAYSENMVLITNDSAFQSLHWLTVLW